MRISVIIPTYKPQSYIWECLYSLKLQTFPKENFEIILVLNGCKEPYLTRIKEYINTTLKGYNVNFIHTDKGGVSYARNIALDIAKGEYITFIDDDDYVSPSYLEELYKKAKPEIVSLSNTTAFIDGNLTDKFKFSLSKVFELISSKGVQPLSKARKYFAGPCMKLIHKSIIKERRFDERFKNGEDCIFMFLISDKIKKINFTSSNAIYYRRYRENSAVTKKRSFFSRLSNALNTIREYIIIYLRNPSDYSFNFFCTRILGTLKSIIYIA